MGQLIQGANDLQTKYPNLAKEWDFAKNAPLSPDRVTCGSIQYLQLNGIMKRIFQ